MEPKKKVKKYLRIWKLRIRIDSIPERLLALMKTRVGGIGSFNVSVGFIVIVVLAVIIIAALIGSEGLGGKTKNPYGDVTGYSKAGARVTPADTALADTLDLWNIFVNNHKHATIEEWEACPNNKDNDPDNDDKAPLQETYTVRENFTDCVPTWLRTMTTAGETITLKPDAGLKIDRDAGLYGQTVSAKSGPAYFKLYYLDEEYERQNGIDILNTDQTNRLTPVPPEDIKAIELTKEFLQIEIYAEALLGKTLAAAYMTQPEKGEDGEPGQDNKGRFIIESYDFAGIKPQPDMAYETSASSETEALAAAANALIEEQKEAADAEGTVRPRRNGKAAIDLPPLPFEGGKALTLTITGRAPDGFASVQPFRVVLSAATGEVVSIDAESGDLKYIEITADRHGVRIWNRAAAQVAASGYDAAVSAWIKKVDRSADGKTENIYYSEDPNADIVAVLNGDTALIRVDLFNHCKKHITIPEIAITLSPGLKFDPFATIAHINEGEAAYNNSLWALDSGAAGAGTTLKYTGDPVRLPPWDGEPGKYPEFRLPLVLTADNPEALEADFWLTCMAEIKRLQDVDGKDVGPGISAEDDEDGDELVRHDRDRLALVILGTKTAYTGPVPVYSGIPEWVSSDAWPEDDLSTTPPDDRDGTSDRPAAANDKVEGNFFSRLLDFFKKK